MKIHGRGTFTFKTQADVGILLSNYSPLQKKQYLKDKRQYLIPIFARIFDKLEKG